MGLKELAQHLVAPTFHFRETSPKHFEISTATGILHVVTPRIRRIGKQVEEVRKEINLAL